MAEEVHEQGCNCSSCEKYRSPEGRIDKEFDFHTYLVDFHFPAVTMNKDEPDLNIRAVVAVFESKQKTGERTDSARRRSTDVVRFLTYGRLHDGDKVLLPLKDVLTICDYLYEDDLEIVIGNDVLADNFLRRTLQLFVYCWSAYFDGHPEAETAARKLRKFLTHIITFPVVERQVKNMFSVRAFWPKVGPLEIIEKLCQELVLCYETVSLLCNLTRIDGFPHLLSVRTDCFKYIKDLFLAIASKIQEGDASGGLLLHFLVNLTSVEEFARYVIGINGNYFINVVMVNLLQNPRTPESIQIAIWPFLRNVAMLDEGRNCIMKSFDLFLGHILYPIAGPEPISMDEAANLPLEVQFLPPTKQRIENKMIRKCIVDILFCLCRFKKDREVLRNMDVYQILKHYHKVEDDADILDRLEDLVNILIRKEGSEIRVDDLLEGLNDDLEESSETGG